MKRAQFISQLIAVGVTTTVAKSYGATRHVGGPCEGCEAIFEFGNKTLGPVDIMPDYKDSGPKMEISGTIYKRDGRTPAKDVILYTYHTDQTGIYPVKGDEKGWGKRHGWIRGWIKTDASGKYKFLTLMPAPYPGRDNPAHVHAIVKEPSVNEYWIDDYLFEGDPLLSEKHRASQNQRAGNGILKPGKTKAGILLAHRDIILGLNIPNY